MIKYEFEGLDVGSYQYRMLKLALDKEFSDFVDAPLDYFCNVTILSADESAIGLKVIFSDVSYEFEFAPKYISVIHNVVVLNINLFEILRYEKDFRNILSEEGLL